MRQDITLDVRKRETSFGRAKLLPLRRGEKGNRELVVSVEEDGRAYDLSGKTASLVATTAAGKLVGPCPMEVAEAGIARIMLPAALYSAVGAFTGYVEIREGETLVDTTDSFGGKVIECADFDSEQAAEFTPLLGELQNAVAEEAKRVEAEKVRAQAETERAMGFAEAKQASQAATEAANDAAADANLAAGTASDAAKSANTAAGKATNAAAKAESDAANTAATQAVSDARDAIAEVKATEAKLYPAAENILVGSETGVVAHVEDAFAGATLRKITVEGACKQDGIPSPDAPKQIAVVENPAVKIVGRNLVDVPSMTVAANQDTSNKVDCGLIPQGENAYLSFVSSAGSVYKGRNAAAWGLFDKDDNPRWSVVPSDFAKGINRSELKPPFDAIKHQIIPTYKEPMTAFEMSDYQLELGGYHDYRPYTKQSIAFTLPAEHPYLAKLPDGTADEIVVGEEGNVEFVARVLRRELTACTSMSDSASQSGEDGTMNYILVLDGAEDAKVANAAACICTRFKNGGTTKNADTIRRGAGNELCYVYTSNSAIIGDGTTQHVTEWLAANPTEIMYEVAEPKRYPLGKIEMSKAQDSIINVWTDAEVTPNTGIEYVRDVNIVVANLESAIASITEG